MAGMTCRHASRPRAIRRQAPRANAPKIIVAAPDHPLLGACVAVVVGIVAFRKHQEANAKGTPGRGAGGQAPVPVVACLVTQKDVPIYLDGLGTVQAFNTVTIHARVDGQLQKVAFTEGQDVHTGDLLAQIDSAPFKTQLAQSQAKKAQDEALLANARRDLEREADLFAAKIDSQQLYQTQGSPGESGRSGGQGGPGRHRKRPGPTFDYTTITSPLDGRTGVRQIDQGNIIHATDSNGLVVITQMRPISVVFTLPEQNLACDPQTNGRGNLSCWLSIATTAPRLAKASWR